MLLIENMRNGYTPEQCGETISQGVCDWFMKHGAKVEPFGIRWRINF